jgi:hypothetical protein
MRALLLALLVVTIALPLLAAGKPRPKRALRRAALGLAIFLMAYLALLFLLPVFEGR